MRPYRMCVFRLFPCCKNNNGYCTDLTQKFNSVFDLDTKEHAAYVSAQLSVVYLEHDGIGTSENFRFVVDRRGFRHSEPSRCSIHGVIIIYVADR